MEKVAKIYSIGKCEGCGSFSKTIEFACDSCRHQFGDRCGKIMKRVRENKNFALLCYRQLNTVEKREKFVEMFGDPQT